MARKLPAHLKIHVEDRQTGSTKQPEFDLENLMHSFADATGWAVRPLAGTPHHPVNDLDRDPPVRPLRMRVHLVSTAPMDGMLDAENFDDLSVTSEESAWNLLEQIDAMVQGIDRAEKTIAAQEAQLSKSLGVSIRKDEAELLASRLQESLHRAALKTGSDAAALYLLDDTTSQLKMRSSWGMASGSLSKPPRELRGSLADLEALMGNAVLLENIALAPEWNCPEAYAAAICVPVGSPTMPHGTIWLWSDHVRDFNAGDIDVVKAAADKILVDIERSVLADEVLRNRGLDRQLDAAGLIQSARLPVAQQLHDDYQLAGWTFQGQSLGGNFHTWTLNRYEQICAALGSAVAKGPAGALVATSVQTVVETCWNSKHKPAQVLRRVNDILWDTAAGDWRSSLCYLQIEPETGTMQLALSGSIQAFSISSYGFRRLDGTPTHLAAQPDTTFKNQELMLEAGELLLLVSEDVVSGLVRGGFTQEDLLSTVRGMADDPVEDIADHLARMLPLLDAERNHEIDRTLLVLRRSF
ncbi:PP2C family protein-serine/threonine phosphatase [Aureliella helgolandensis]|uniref:Stage II sporulation protein E (SpoIIE) n=1 Tax=Aureliella helgolandensis TaxID=2527968 RepID=A0A518G5P8_9BACT|nr:SpoIIE family protein phosphatase [Aureliella helgolandensis]QDV23908.1 Stage II sporulation protein E (SpoIIE) [Aureliella helgolandensis]